MISLSPFCQTHSATLLIQVVALLLIWATVMAVTPSATLDYMRSVILSKRSGSVNRRHKTGK